MMGGFGMFTMMFWMVLGTLLFIVLATVVIWFLVRWLNRQKAPMMPYTPQQESYRTYERGYQPQKGRKPIKKVGDSTTLPSQKMSTNNHKYSTHQNKRCHHSANLLQVK